MGKFLHKPTVFVIMYASAKPSAAKLHLVLRRDNEQTVRGSGQGSAEARVCEYKKRETQAQRSIERYLE